MDKPITILLAEDEPALGQIIKESLETRHFKVLLCANGETALETYRNQEPELLVLDVMMPKKDGFTLAKEIRAIDEQIPIIFLTAKSQTQDVVEGFSIGGNDYLKKPFSMEELIVRIDNLLHRKTLQITSELLEIGKYHFNFPKQLLFFENASVQLTHREAHLLFHLVKNKNKVLDRSLILNKLWGNDDFFSARSMDVFISKLRKKLQQDAEVQIINVRGFGYKLVF
ncbi:response regulator transcription factor [Subsaximicrobium wynnwilliamsii]|jgi:DNA-binding response OmpR family regulator|uniref:Response regulator transcription factor n=1 Tax=Subsaximicrobium wynnwilliamsii TaxID=291179 RepID=A0A5C6ZQ77_9FLAO|nr:response regulator transcription factor [Subsaximicrobium wynnwilliamsii]TXD85470.1 response regulator transcription factor [Subsaximicrobium wynnwilliamsii]TXD90823.1 response regulator transcription factor [Subsaximicrobium wynnwilliamsii]TXE05330.1 response regulator transcription factor [Subsaximicrobium wynnwilliamsii]